jgi:transcriptional regulator with XRE-family HTH domain
MTDSDLDLYARDNPVIRLGLAQVDFINEVASQLRTLREQAGLTQKQMGQLVGVSQPRIAQIESGKPDAAASLEQIAAYAFHCERVARIGFEMANRSALPSGPIVDLPLQIEIKYHGFEGRDPDVSSASEEEEPGVRMEPAKFRIEG